MQISSSQGQYKNSTIFLNNIKLPKLPQIINYIYIKRTSVVSSSSCMLIVMVYESSQNNQIVIKQSFIYTNRTYIYFLYKLGIIFLHTHTQNKNNNSTKFFSFTCFYNFNFTFYNFLII